MVSPRCRRGDGSRRAEADPRRRGTSAHGSRIRGSTPRRRCQRLRSARRGRTDPGCVSRTGADADQLHRGRHAVRGRNHADEPRGRARSATPPSIRTEVCVTRRDGRPRHQQIAADLRALIMSGDLVGKLPTTHQLMEMYAVGSPTVQRALQVLKDERFVEGRRGSGVYALERVAIDSVAYIPAGAGLRIQAAERGRSRTTRRGTPCVQDRRRGHRDTSPQAHDPARSKARPLIEERPLRAVSAPTRGVSGKTGVRAKPVIPLRISCVPDVIRAFFGWILSHDLSARLGYDS